MYSFPLQHPNLDPGGSAWFWFDVFVVCGSAAEVFFEPQLEV